ncbi:MAG TPA: hypothetical protein DEB06_08130 [Phycisphaerales bacterium]|nr:hypothetical protein [Phycisphaerales bacterium]
MKTACLLLTLALLAPLASARQEAPVARRGYEATALVAESLEVPFLRWGDAIMVENVMINGKGPYRFVLDTGAEGAGRIDQAVIDALALPAAGSGRTRHIIGEEREVVTRRLDTLSIGALSFSNVTLIGGDYDARMRSPGLGPVHGILGYHLFSEYLLTIDYPGRMIRVAKGALPEPDGKSVLAIVSDDEDPEVEVTIGGQSAKALLDTGAQTMLALPSAFAKQVKFSGELEPMGRERPAKVHRGTLDGAVRLGEIEIDDPATVVSETLVQPVVGVRSLALLAVTYDQKNGRVRVVRPAARPRFGIEFGWTGARPYRFSGVTDNGAAAAAGLRATDRIISINGQAFETIDRESMLRLQDLATMTLVVEREGAEMVLRLSPR